MIGRAEAADMLAAAEAELFKALAHPARARVVSVLAQGPASVPDLCAATGLKPSHLAGHLAQLRAQHLVAGKRLGGRLLYGLSFPEIARVLAEADAVLSLRTFAEADGLAAMTAPETAPHDGVNEDVAAMVEELIPVLEQSLESRALIAAAVESVSVRTGVGSEAALAALLAESRERGRTLAETASEAVAGDVTE